MGIGSCWWGKMAIFSRLESMANPSSALLGPIRQELSPTVGGIVVTVSAHLYHTLAQNKFVNHQITIISILDNTDVSAMQSCMAEFAWQSLFGHWIWSPRSAVLVQFLRYTKGIGSLRAQAKGHQLSINQLALKGVLTQVSKKDGNDTVVKAIVGDNRDKSTQQHR